MWIILVFSLLGAWDCFLDCMDTEVEQNNGNMLKIETNFNMVWNCLWQQLQPQSYKVLTHTKFERFPKLF